MLANYPSDVHRCSRASYTQGLFLLLHDFQYCRLSSQTSDRSLSTMCWSCLRDNHRDSFLLHIKTHFLTQYNSRHAICLHSPQTGVCLLCARTLGSFSTTLGITVCLRNLQTKVCPLGAEVPSWLKPLASPFIASQESSQRPTRLSVLLYVFTALRLESICCEQRLVFCLARPSVQPFVFIAIRPESVRYVLGPAQHDPQCNRPFSQPLDRSLSTVCQDFAPQQVAFVEACWSFLEGRFPFFFFGSVFRTMCPLSLKFIT